MTSDRCQCSSPVLDDSMGETEICLVAHFDAEGKPLGQCKKCGRCGKYVPNVYRFDSDQTQEGKEKV